MVKTFCTTLASGMLVLLFCTNSKAQGINDPVFGRNMPTVEYRNDTLRSDLLRKQMKQLRKQLDSLSRELETIELPDINSYDLNWSPPHIHIPKLKIETPPLDITPPDEFDLTPNVLPLGIIRGKTDSRPSTRDQMPIYRGPKTRKYKKSEPLPDFPKWKIELLKDFCTTL